MPHPPPTAPPDSADPCHGFTLAHVGWAHRDRFARRIRELCERGLLGPERARVTATFFAMLCQADRGAYDYVLRHFLDAINPRTEWLLDEPLVFADVVDLGRELAHSRPHRGVLFFGLLAEPGLGQTPEQVRQMLRLARRLLRVDADLCLAFLKEYARLAERLQPADLDRFIDAALAADARNPRAGLAFMQGALENAAALVRSLAQECCLQDIQGALGAVAQALAGHELDVVDLGALPAADVAGRGCRCVLLGRTLYLPARVRGAPTRQCPHGGYTLATVVAAGTLRFDSFTRIHGQPRYPSLRGLVGDDPLALNALLLAEWHRVLQGCCRDWPGIRRLLQAGVEQDTTPAPGASDLPPVVRGLLLGGAAAVPEAVAHLAAAAQDCPTVLHTAALLTPSRLADLRHACPELALGPLPPLSFMPDFLFPARHTSPAAAPTVLDWLHAATGEPRPPNRAAPRPAEPAPDEAPAPAVSSYSYDEWSSEAQDYRRGYCQVQETVPTGAPGGDLPADLAAAGQRVRRACERLKPDSARREKYLRDGDEIGIDRLVDFVMQRGVDPAPRADFYEKPRSRRREVAVLILLDLSGSTGDPTPTGERILDLERHAAMILGEGLTALGDRFAVCGFNSAGPQHCTFLVFKDFAERWTRGTRARLQAAVPAQRTRIGPALRHAGWRLSRVPSRQRLILLITDGQPSDTGYAPATHYAQADVRKACEENARAGIHTFAVSTAENSRADLEIMFPGRRFAILPDVRLLPRVLPAVYSRLTL